LKITIRAHFWVALGIVTIELGQTDLVLVCNQGSLVGLYVQDYKSLCAGVTTCATLFDLKLDFIYLTRDLQK